MVDGADGAKSAALLLPRSSALDVPCFRKLPCFLKLAWPTMDGRWFCETEGRRAELWLATEVRRLELSSGAAASACMARQRPMLRRLSH